MSAPKLLAGLLVLLFFGGALLFVAAPHPVALVESSGQVASPTVETPRRAGAVEVEWCATFADAAASIAQMIEQELLRAGARKSREGVTVFLAPGAGEEKSREAVTEVKRALVRRKIHLNDRTGWPVEIALDESPNGSAIECTLLANREKRRVAFGGPADLGVPLHRSSSDLVLSLKTSMAWSEVDSREDALDLLRAKIIHQAFDSVVRSGHIGSSDKEKFWGEFAGRYSRELLIAQGDFRISTTKLETPDGDRYDSYLVWRSPRERIGNLAATTAKTITFEKRLPFIRVGLALGSLVLAILAWLRMDWWLKGHHSFLTKVACGILWAITVGLIWSWPKHG